MKRILFGLLLIVLVIPHAFYPVPATTAWHEKTILWTRFLGLDQGYGSPVVDSEHVYVANSSSIYCFGMDSGELLWEKNFDKPAKTFPLQANVSINRKYAFFCNPDGLRCLNKTTGETIWSIKAFFTSNAELALSNAYVASTNTIFKLDADTGNILQLKDFCDKDPYRFLTYAGKDKLIASTFYGTRKLVDISTGKTIWEDTNKLSNIREKPVVSGKNLIISGQMFGQNKLLVVDLETGANLKELNYSYNSQCDVSDGKILLPDRCLDSETFKPVWFNIHGMFRSFDCFDTVCFWEYDRYKVLDWNGNEIQSKEDPYYPGDNLFYDNCIAKPATSDGRYFLVTERGYLVSYGNKPESITYTPGDDFIIADGNKITLEHQPRTDNRGVLVLEPASFLEPLGWVGSHYKHADSKVMYVHDYKKHIELYDSYRSRKSYIKSKRIPCQTEDDGTFVMPLEQMVSEFGLTMTKEDDRIRLSYQSK